MKAQIDNYSCWIDEADPGSLKNIFADLLTKSGFGLINCIEHYFEPQGYTCLWLLSESHFAIHTFPEEHRTYIELSSCNREMFDQFLIHLREYTQMMKV